MYKKMIITAFAAGLLGVSAIATAAGEADATQAPSTAQAPVAVPSMNPMDPAAVAAFMRPGSHRVYHQALMNPGNWVQFAQPQYYMQMANPALMMQWMNPASYQAMMDPNTYMYWMQPNVMMSEMGSINPAVYMNPASYQALMNPNSYMAWMNPAAYTAAAQQMTVPAYDGNWFDMSAWTQFMQPAPQPQAGKDEG
jgi:hypothetical protein